jgi:hypothetical protein
MNYKDVIISIAKDLHHPGLCLVTFCASPESTPPVQEWSLWWKKSAF